ncbi:DUF6011 domain-containing protein [Mycolicibacterium sp. GESEQ-9]
MTTQGIKTELRIVARCTRCGRYLIHEKSVERGIGSTCAARGDAND